MKPWLKRTLIVVVAVVVLYGAFVAYAEYNNGSSDEITLHLGTNADGSMYLKCGEIQGDARCTGGDQAQVRVQQRDRITFRLVNDDGGDHSHDFKLDGWQYALPPISPEMELHQTTESWSFTAWASGSYKMWCEIAGHDTRGMHGTFVVE